MYYHEEHFKHLLHGNLVLDTVCSSCRFDVSNKMPVDCFVCGATVFFTEQQLDLRANYSKTKICQHPNGHLIVFRDKYVAACCMPVVKVHEITVKMGELVEKMPVIIK